MSFRRWNQFTKAAVAAVVTALVAVGCQELETQNPNAPSTEQLATPSDLEGLLDSSYLQYWASTHYYWPGNMLSVGADHHSSPWGNFGMLDFGSEPRWGGTGDPFNNQQTYTYAFATEHPWFGCHSGVVGASDALIAMGEGSEGANVSDPVTFADSDRKSRAIAFGKFIQGICMGFLGAMFDRSYVVTEDVARFEGGSPIILDFTSYGGVVDAAVAALQAGIQEAENADFNLPSGWINGASLSSGEFADLMRSYIARFEASQYRSQSEAMSAPATSWELVRDMAQQGIDSDHIVSADTEDGFWDGIKTLGGDWDIIWSRLDMREVGPADTSGNWETWMTTPVQQRGQDGSVLDIFTPDARFPDPDPDTGEFVNFTSGAYFHYVGFIFYPPGRGTYHFSWIADNRYADYAFSCTFCWFGDVPEMTATEMDLLEAEAHLMLGDDPLAVPLINNSREGVGGLDPVTTGGVPNSFPECVPHDLQGDGTCADLAEALYYEKGVEVFQVSAGLPYFDDRRWNLLTEGTPIHLPVPGLELETLEMDIYSWGGVGMSGGAPAPSTSLGLAAASRSSSDGGPTVYTRDRISEQIAWDQQWLDAQMKALQERIEVEKQ